MAEINKRVRDIADQVKTSTIFSNSSLTANMDDSSHVIIKADNNIYEKNLPDGITLETIKNLEEYNSDFQAGVLLGVGESTLKLMGENSTVMCSTASINSEPGRQISTYIGIHEDPDKDTLDGSNFSFNSHIRPNFNTEINTDGLTQGQVVRRHLRELYTKALCESMK